MNELTNISETTAQISALDFKDKKLASYSKRVIEIADNMRKSSLKVASIFSAVQTSKCYKADGFDSMADWAEKTFGLKKSVAYAMAKVGTDYVNPKTGKSVLTSLDAPKDFSVTQLAELSKLPKKDVTAAVDAGKITPEMTCKELREYADENKPKKAEKKTASGKPASKPKGKLYSGTIKRMSGAVETVTKQTMEAVDKLCSGYTDRKQYKNAEGAVRVVYEYPTSVAMFCVEE